MKNSCFQRIVVIGCGTIACDVLRYCKERAEGYALVYIEYAAYPFNAATAYAARQGIPCISAREKKEVADYIGNLLEKTLIISANNTYVFPRNLVDKSNLTIVNFHNSLLPAYPGMNAASWAIYYGEKQTGITWHYVSAGIDEGDIIAQMSCQISPDIKAYELAQRLMQLGSNTFREIFGNVMQESVQKITQRPLEDRKLFLAKTIPGDGKFRLDDAPESIYRLLRAMDYGAREIFPRPKTIYNNQEIEITGYQLVDVAKNACHQEDVLLIPYDGARSLLLHFLPSNMAV